MSEKRKVEKKGRRSNHLVPDDFAGKSGFNKNQDLSFDQVSKLFIDDCRIRNLSAYTIQSYSQKLEQIRDFLFDAEPDMLPKNVNLGHIKEHIIIRLLDEGRSEVTVNGLLRVTRALYNFLHSEGYVNINPVDKLKLLKENQKIVPTFSNEDLQVLFAQPDLRTFTGVRDYTIMLMLLDTGIRVRELRDITIYDINWKDNLITIQGKGFKQSIQYGSQLRPGQRFVWPEITLPVPFE
jgi:integrase/recombinase XerD